MGGLITRFALAAMGMTARTTRRNVPVHGLPPHNGAWVPDHPATTRVLLRTPVPPTEPGKPRQADLIRSPAAQHCCGDGWRTRVTAARSRPRRHCAANSSTTHNSAGSRRGRGCSVSRRTGDGTGTDMPAGEAGVRLDRVGASRAPRSVRNRHSAPASRSARCICRRAAAQLHHPDTAIRRAPGGTLAVVRDVADALGAALTSACARAVSYRRSVPSRSISTR